MLVLPYHSQPRDGVFPNWYDNAIVISISEFERVSNVLNKKCPDSFIGYLGHAGDHQESVYLVPRENPEGASVVSVLDLGGMSRGRLFGFSRAEIKSSAELFELPFDASRVRKVGIPVESMARIGV